MRLTGIAVLAALVCLAWISAPIGLADLSAFAPRQTLIRSERETFPLPSDPAWTRGREQLARALDLDPRNPNLLELIAQWHERTASRLPPRTPASVGQLRQSLDYFRRAAVYRPGSPYTWSNIAVVKLRLGELDEEFTRAIVNAAQYGPWEPEVQLAMADVFFTTRRLPAEAHRAVRQLTDNATRHYSDRLYARAVELGQLALLCSLPNAGTSKFAIRCI